MDNQSILKSFMVRDKLNPKIWELPNERFMSDPKGQVETMVPKVRERLLDIANQFVEFLDVPVFVDDVIMTGSLANYNWSNYSDVDLHIIVDFTQFPEEQIELFQKLFTLKKILFNTNHDITIKNFEVELYAQDEKEIHTSSGVYSVLYDEWITKPEKINVKVDNTVLMNKVKSWTEKIDEVIEDVKESNDLEKSKEIIDKLKKKLKDYRGEGLSGDGEFSYENLVFKFLRRNGYIEKLYNFEDKLIDKTLSLENSIDE
jgi:predicted nucleotidyltransferase